MEASAVKRRPGWSMRCSNGEHGESSELAGILFRTHYRVSPPHFHLGRRQRQCTRPGLAASLRCTDDRWRCRLQGGMGAARYRHGSTVTVATARIGAQAAASGRDSETASSARLRFSTTLYSTMRTRLLSEAVTGT
jgi:hypothetical protein